MTLWKTFIAAPHRVMFFAGLAQFMLTIGWWSVELTARYAAIGTPLQTALPSTFAHAWLMLFGVFPFLMFGFLMTTYPRWMNGPLVTERDYIGAFLLMSAGVLLFYVGLFAGSAWVMIGIGLHAFGFAFGAYGLHSVYRAVGASRDRRYETQLNIALASGIAAELSYLGWIATDEPLLLQAALHGALWLFLVPVLVLVAHRMLPFFSSSVIPNYTLVQPRWTFPLLWAAVVLHFALENFGLRQWLFLADAPLLFLTLHHTIAWQFRRSLSNRLLGSLHIAFAFLSIGLALHIVQSLWLLLADQFILGRAPLHAIALGFIAGMVVAMITRVSRGHSGRPLVMENLDWYAFVMILGAALLRIAGEVAVIAMNSPVSPNLIAAFVWLAGAVPWGVRYMVIYLRPRLDGKPG